MKKIWLAFAGVVAVLAVLVLGGCNTEGSLGDVNVNLNSQSQGIWVSGEGKVSVTPDLAIISVGVQSQETTVAEAQEKASAAMDALIQALKDQGVDEKDIQTQYFNISQVTRWDNDKMTENVTGYRVTNTVTVKIRDISKAGNIIDSVVAAGGDLTRVKGITFTLEDPTSAYNDARAKAIDNAQAKAQQIANESGAKLGKITYITENNYYQPIYRGFDSMETSGTVPMPTIATSISEGELEITTTVQIAYAID